MGKLLEAFEEHFTRERLKFAETRVRKLEKENALMRGQLRSLLTPSQLRDVLAGEADGQDIELGGDAPPEKEIRAAIRRAHCGDPRWPESGKRDK